MPFMPDKRTSSFSREVGLGWQWFKVVALLALVALFLCVLLVLEIEIVCQLFGGFMTGKVWDPTKEGGRWVYKQDNPASFWFGIAVDIFWGLVFMHLTIRSVIRVRRMIIAAIGDHRRAGWSEVVTRLGQQSGAIARLCHHIVEQRQKMLVDAKRSEIIWSDGAILEVGANFPGALQELISRPTEHQNLWSFVEHLETDADTPWRNASVNRSAPDDTLANVGSMDGKVSATVMSLYTDYLEQRYPTASIRIKGEFEPIIFVVDGKIRATLMPVQP